MKTEVTSRPTSAFDMIAAVATFGVQMPDTHNATIKSDDGRTIAEASGTSRQDAINNVNKVYEKNR